MFSWHAVGVKQTLDGLRSSEIGLGDKEARRRFKHFGPNEISPSRTNLIKKIIEPFNSVFILVLMAAAIISWAAGEKIDAAVIAGIIAVNALIYYVQSYAAGRILRSLKKHSRQTVEVLRNGRLQPMDSKYLVPGDIIVVSEGQKVPADARLLTADNLQADESSLTGESFPVNKHPGTVAADKPVFERHNMIYQGTFVTAGTAKAAVVATGAFTEFGQVARLAADNDDKSPVQQKIDHLISRLIRYLIVAGGVVFLLALYRGLALDEASRFVLSLMVAAVPEGLPVALTVIMVLGMRRMARDNALVRSLKALEDIGLVTTIATDKTGTLTENRLQVVEHWSPADNKFLRHLAMTTPFKDDIKDSLDEAIVEYAGPVGSRKPTKIFPFEQSQRMSGSLWSEEGRYALYAKGSPEHLLNLARLPGVQHQAVESRLHELTANGFRVLAVAKAMFKQPPSGLGEASGGRFEFLGLVAFADQLRPEAVKAVRQAQAAGINVRLITGDHYGTAYHIAKLTGIASHPSQVAMGSQLPPNEAGVLETLRHKSVFARILPQDKFRILHALKKHEITAMTGDGVNDVPALANAHVGIAMGSGSDIAKDAGDIVLLDNNFATIIKAIADGRVIYDNIRRMLVYLLSANMGIVLTVTLALLLGMPLPLTAIQVLWINLVTDTAMVLPLGLEPPEDKHMRQPPRRPKEPILTKFMLRRIFMTSAVMAAATLLPVYILDSRGYSLPFIQTVAFLTLVSAQWMNAFNCRSENESLLRRFKKPNHGLTIGFLLALALQLVAIYGPLAGMLGIEIISQKIMFMSALIAVWAVFLTAELHKAYDRRR